MGKKISIIIVTYNSESHIYNCLDSIFQFNDIGNDLEIIIVDNCSKLVDEMFELIGRKYGSEIILLKNKNNGGYGQGNNIGIKHASGPIIMIMNPDVRLIHPVFSIIINHFINKEVAMLGMKQLVSDTKKGLSFNTSYSVDNIIGFFMAVILNKLNLYIQNYMYLSGACFFIRKNIFEKIGFFDEKIFLYGEENDIHHRLKNASKKYRILYDNHLSYYHLTDNRPLTMIELQRMLDSKIKFYNKYNIAPVTYYKREIRYAKFIRLVQLIKGKSKNVQLYKEWIIVLKNKALNSQ